MLGNVFNLKAVKEFCTRHGLFLIDDNCNALGAEYEIVGKFKKSGIVGDIVTSNFYPAHHMTMGEGRAVYTRNPLLHRIVRSLRDWGRDCICSGRQDNRCGHRFDGQYGTLSSGCDHKYVYSHQGYNLKVTDMQDYFVPPEIEPGSVPSWFSFMLLVRVEARKARDQVTAYPEKHRIWPRTLFAEILKRHPCFEALEEGNDYCVADGPENAEIVMNRSFWANVYPGMTKAMLDEMILQIHESVQQPHAVA